MEEKLKFEIYKYLDRKYSVGDLAILYPMFLIISIILFNYLHLFYFSFILTFFIAFLKVLFWMVIIAYVIYLFSNFKQDIIKEEYAKITEFIKNQRGKKNG